MKDFFTRSKLNPILRLNPDNKWESLKVYNPGAVFHDGEYHLFYRAVGRGKSWHSAIGYAVSKDGENFERFPGPILKRDRKDPLESRGLEDPRVTKVEDMFFMAYAAYDGKVPRLSIATSKDLKNWQKRGLAFEFFNFTGLGGVFVRWRKGRAIERIRAKFTEEDERTKAGAIFPEKIGDKYWMVFNEFRIWLANSEDGIKWNAFLGPFLSPRKNTEFFDNVFVEAGPPPIKTDRGWLVLYHGVNDAAQYHLGALLLDLSDPRKILFRSNEPVFGPREAYEISGSVPDDIVPGALKLLEEGRHEELKVLLKKSAEEGFKPKITFVPSAVVTGDTIRIFYGASDEYICTATASLSEILESFEKEVLHPAV